MRRLLSELAIVCTLAWILACAATGRSGSGDEVASTPQNTAVDRLDAAELECERVRIGSRSPTRASLEGLATEGGHADVFAENGNIVRVRGALLFETSRVRFDYVFDEGALQCAEETVSSIRVSSDGEPGWQYFWHHQHLVFVDGDLASHTMEHTTGARARGRAVDGILRTAEEVMARVRRAEDGSARNP